MQNKPHHQMSSTHEFPPLCFIQFIRSNINEFMKFNHLHVTLATFMHKFAVLCYSIEHFVWLVGRDWKV